MKTIFNKQKRSVAGVLIALTALTTALTGCQEDFELDLPLAVSARELSLTKDAGSTHVLVYSNGDWTARFTRPVKWASLNKLQGYGNNEIVFTYSANYGISRKIGVVFEKGSLTDTVMFSQAGAITDASLSFSKPAVTLLKSRSQIFTPISTNLRYCIDDLEASVTYYDNDGLPNDPVTVLTRAEEGAVFAETIPFTETRNYVQRVLANTVHYASYYNSDKNVIKLSAILGTVTPKPIQNVALP